MSAYQLTRFMQKIGETPRDYGPLLVLYLTLMNHPDASPGDICGAQAVSLSVCKEYERIARTPVADLATVIQFSWQKITQDRAFTLSAPRLIRDTLSKCVEPSIPNAARILLSAQASTGAKLDSALRQFPGDNGSRHLRLTSVWRQPNVDHVG